ncbi:blue copper protein-like [Canna indica]|uniref:Blue copper protein-like n=1 Tax=Canna indica TaxID=4628 RepID=A0AAQ3LAC3_9LILI|nr:blue copper protein-like [Canna indica]
MAGFAPAAFGALLLMAISVSAKDYTVGDSSGWTNGFDYKTWSSGITLVTGDTLTFNYAAGVHTVDQVSSTDYTACSASNALSTDGSGTTTVTLSKPGNYYYICGVASHCSNGMKLSVSVTAPPTSSPTTPSTSPSTPTTTPPSADSTPSTTPTTPSTTPTPVSTTTTPSGGASLAASFATVVGLVALKLVVF